MKTTMKKSANETIAYFYDDESGTVVRALFAGLGSKDTLSGRSLTLVGAHCRAQGRNQDSIGICYIGGKDCEGNAADPRTREQKIAIEARLQGLKAVWPEAQISGHRAWTSTECPSFDAGRAYRHITGDPLLK